MIAAGAKRRNMDMTVGPVLSKLIRLAIPLILTNLLQIFYNAADMMVVGLSTEPDAVGAVGTTSSFVSLLLNVFAGFSVGANVVIARRLGAGDEEGASRATHTATVAGLFLGVASGAAGLIFARPVMALMGNEGRLLDLSVSYLRIYFITMPFHSLVNYAASIHRAKGDTRTPLMVLSLTGILNVLLNLFFVLVCGLSVEGVSLATGISAAVSAAVLYANLMRQEGALRFSFRKLRVDKDAMRDILLIGLPAGVQGALFSVANMMIQSSIIGINNAQFGADDVYQPIVKGNAAGHSLELFGYNVCHSISHAAMTFTGQNVGAGDRARTRRVIAASYLISFVAATFMAIVLLVFASPLLSLYGVKYVEGDIYAMAAFEAGKLRLVYMMAVYFLLGYMEMGSGILRAFGKSATSTFNSLLGGCGFRILWLATAFRAVPTLECVYLSYPLSWGLTALVQFVCAMLVFRRMKWKEEAPQKETLTDAQ